MTNRTSDLRPTPEEFWRPKGTGLTSIDLFAGSGGLSLGLHSIGWRGVFAVEKDPMAFETLRQNFLRDGSPFRAFEEWPDWLPQEPLDIVKILQSDTTKRRLRKLRGTIDLVAGGPPCQGFSVGGARRGESDPRNDLPFQFVDFVKLTQPRMVLLENVEGFDRPFAHQGHRESYADVIQREFQAAGYTTTKHLLHAIDYGVPQTRRRVVIFGVRCNVAQVVLHDAFELLLRAYAQEFRSEWLPDTSFPVSVQDALDDLNSDDTVVTPDSPKYRSPKYRPAKSSYSRLMRAFTKSGDTPDSHRIASHTERILDLIRVAQESQQPGRLTRSFLLGMGTKSRKKFLLGRDIPASTLTSHPDEFFHYEQQRIITLREGARLQGFPDAFVFRGRYTLNGDRRGLDVSRCAQVGNAIPPLLGRALGFAAERIAAAGSTEELESVLALLSGYARGQQKLPMA